jgi:formamidopyrimidine-DNA glycosylase
MPELPDVEWTRGRLQKWMRGASITSARSDDARVLRPRAPAVVMRSLVGRRIESVSRRGKWLRIELDHGVYVFSHLGMTGEWVERSTEEPTLRAERVRLDLRRADGRAASVRYLDARRFGRLLVAREDILEWRELGPDPLADGLRVSALRAAFARRRRAVKETLMDQTVLAGVGNILATEALFYARIDPRSRSDALSEAQVGAVVRGLRKAIRKELATRERAGDEGWTDVFEVYGRKGQACRRCETPLEHIVLGGRGTTFCRKCQVRRNSRVVETGA